MKYHFFRQKKPSFTHSTSQVNSLKKERVEKKKNPSEFAKAQMRPDSTVNCLVASLCLSRGTWGLNAAHFICWTTWELGARGITMRMPSVSRELTKPAPPSLLRGPCTDGHSLVNWKNAYHCLTQRAPLPPPPPPLPPPPPRPLPNHHPVAASAISSLHPSLTFSLWISLSGHQPLPSPPPLSPPVPLWALKELYYWPPLSVTAPSDRLLKAQLYVSIEHESKRYGLVQKNLQPTLNGSNDSWAGVKKKKKLSAKCLNVQKKGVSSQIFWHLR